MGRRIAMTAALAGLLLPAACVQEDGGQTGRATVTLTVMTRAVSTSEAEDGMLEDNEQMKTLRVIVARNTTGEILYNKFYDDLDDDKNGTKKTIPFSELTVNEEGENFDFYAIANEDGFLGTGENLEDRSLDLKALKEKIISNDFNITNAGNIPQTAFATQWVGPGGEESLDMQLEFVVAKVYVQFVNETGTAQSITGIKMENVNPGQGYLFEDETDTGIKIPSGVTYTDLEIGNAENIPAEEGNNTMALKGYLYPGQANNYALKAMWNGTEYILDGNSITSGNWITSLDRSQQLSIIVTLNGTSEPVEVAFQWKVSQWGEEKIEVPPFN